MAIRFKDTLSRKVTIQDRANESCPEARTSNDVVGVWRWREDYNRAKFNDFTPHLPLINCRRTQCLASKQAVYSGCVKVHSVSWIAISMNTAEDQPKIGAAFG